MSQFVRKIFFGVSFASTCRSQTYPLSSQIFYTGKYSRIWHQYMTFVDVRRSLCKNMTERRYIDLLYYLCKYLHILAHNDNIMTNTKLHILVIVTCTYMLFAWFWQFTLCTHNNCYFLLVINIQTMSEYVPCVFWLSFARTVGHFAIDVLYMYPTLK